jgi:hypothetical protein
MQQSRPVRLDLDMRHRLVTTPPSQEANNVEAMTRRLKSQALAVTISSVGMDP